MGARWRSFAGWATGRNGIFVVEILYLVGLWLAAVLYFTHTLHPRHSVGQLPTAVPWFGALGAVLTSLVGVFEHPLDWNPRHAQWHWARPLVGASFAVISVMIFQAGVLSVGSDPNNAGKSLGLYYLVGFVVGYREETFREMIKRLVDVILATDSAPDVAPVVTTVTPAVGPAGGATKVTIDGTGFVKVLSVKFGAVDASGVTTESSTRIKATAPPAAGPGKVSVIVETKGGKATGDFAYQ